MTSDQQHYVDFDEFIDFHLAKTRANIKYTEIFTTLVTTATQFLGYLLVFVVLDQWIIDGGFGYGPRMIMLGLVLSAILATVIRKVVWPWLKNVNVLYAARIIERAEPELKSSLLNVVDLRDAGQPIPP